MINSIGNVSSEDLSVNWYKELSRVVSIEVERHLHSGGPNRKEIDISNNISEGEGAD